MAIATCSNRLYLLNMYRYIHGHSGINKVFELLSWSPPPTRINTSVVLLHYSHTRASQDSRKNVGRAIVTSPALRSVKHALWQRVKRCSFAGTRCWWYIRWIVLLRFRWITDMNNSAPSAICCYRLFQWHDAFMANVFVSKPTRVFTVFMFLWSTIIHYCSAVWYMAQTGQQRVFLVPKFLCDTSLLSTQTNEIMF